jgi:hypothetical protein
MFIGHYFKVRPWLVEELWPHYSDIVCWLISSENSNQGDHFDQAFLKLFFPLCCDP